MAYRKSIDCSDDWFSERTDTSPEWQIAARINVLKL